MNDLGEYIKYRPQMKTGDRLEFTGRSPLGWAIRLFTRKKVNHTAVVLQIPYPGLENRLFSIEALDDGIEIHLLSRRLQTYKGKVYYAALIASDEKRLKMGKWMLLHEGIWYDWKSLLANAFKRVSQDAQRLFCSEFYQMALADVNLIPKDEKALRPGEFDRYDIFGTEVRII
jgi:hypothetical protein